MQMFDNITEFVKDDLQKEKKPGCRVSIAAAYFPIYAYQELKEPLSGIAKLRFLFTSPTFTTERAAKEKREFDIPRLMREQCLCESDFKVKLRNELTPKTIDIAKERERHLQLESRLVREKQFNRQLEFNGEAIR